MRSHEIYKAGYGDDRISQRLRCGGSVLHVGLSGGFRKDSEESAVAGQYSQAIEVTTSLVK